MGIGPISSIYHARFMRYLTHRNLLNCEAKEGAAKGVGRVWRWRNGRAESTSALTLAAREGLDNLVGWSTATCSAWTARCAAMAASLTNWSDLFAGAGWNVVKLVWGSDWTACLPAT